MAKKPVPNVASAPLPTRYRDLTLGLVCVLLLPPFLAPVFPRASLVGAGIFVVLAVRSLVADTGTRFTRGVLATAVLAVGIRAVGSAGLLWAHTHGLELGMRLLTVLAFTVVAIAFLKKVLEAGPVDAEKLFAAVATYLMVGLAFASVYEALLVLRPDSFSFSGSTAGDRDAMFYFSLVTLSTVGYGDIVPDAPDARVLAVFEAIAGQLYLAILMARLVGLHLNRAHDRLERGDTPKDSEP